MSKISENVHMPIVRTLNKHPLKNLSTEEACESWNPNEQQKKANSPSSGLVIGFWAPMRSKEWHNHATINNPNVQAFDWYIPLTH